MIQANFQDSSVYDVIIIGGGITGAGAARDAALRGLSCLLLEKGDFASGVTSKSTRLIHGGLRYLANFEMDLVAESLSERAILRKQAPYLIRPMPILIPIYRGDAHGRTVISVGIHMYDLLSHEKDIPHYFTSDREKTLGFEPRLNPDGLAGSALFYDHQIIMPERLVMENIISAREQGAQVRNYVQAEHITETDDRIVVQARDVLTGAKLSYHSRSLVNAAGPWIDQVRKAGGISDRKIIFPTKGIHLILPKLSEQALFVTSRDGRMFFIIPFGRHSLVGTTDTKFPGDLDNVHADQADVEYLLAESKRVLPTLNLSKDSVLYTYAGIRPLAFSGTSESKISRKHRVIREGIHGRIITIAGGKLTTYRNMAKDVIDAVCREIKNTRHCTTDHTPLPGGLPGELNEYFDAVIPELASSFKVASETVRHLMGIYGSRVKNVLELTRNDALLKLQFAPDCLDISAQVVYSVREELARSVSDIMLRRMHIGLTASRGREKAEMIADLAGRELGWNADEKQASLEQYYLELNSERECLKKAVEGQI